MANSLNKITTKSILDATIATADIADDAVTEDKLANAINTSIAGKAVLTGSTDNTICTVTGANAISGEANLTFDGTTLKTTASTDAQLKITAGNASSQSRLLFEDSAAVDATITYDHNDRLLHIGAGTSTPTDGDLVIDSSGNVQIGATAPLSPYSSSSQKLTVYKADGNGGVLELGGSTNADAYNAGQILFTNAANANNTAWQSDSKLVGLIRAETITTDSNAGDDSGADLAFYTKPEAEAGALAMTIHGEGYVTKSKQPYAKLHFNSGSAGGVDSSALTKQDSVVTSTVSNGMSHTTGRITVPYAGTYIIHAHNNNLEDGDAHVQLRVNGSQINGGGAQNADTDLHWKSMDITTIVALNANDYVESWLCGKQDGQYWNSFIVTLLY